MVLTLKKAIQLWECSGLTELWNFGLRRSRFGKSLEIDVADSKKAAEPQSKAPSSRSTPKSDLIRD